MAVDASDAYLKLIARIREYLKVQGVPKVTIGIERAVVCLLAGPNTIPGMSEVSRVDRRIIRAAIETLSDDKIGVVVPVLGADSRINPNARKQKYRLRDRINVDDWVPMPVGQILHKMETVQGQMEVGKREDELEVFFE